jgi:hypothetical protein
MNRDERTNVYVLQTNRSQLTAKQRTRLRKKVNREIRVKNGRVKSNIRISNGWFMNFTTLPALRARLFEYRTAELEKQANMRRALKAIRAMR